MHPHASSRLPRGGRGSQPMTSATLPAPVDVASREGGVDRNLRSRSPRRCVRSPPARGAWIATSLEDEAIGSGRQGRLPRGGRGSQQAVLESEINSRSACRLPRGGRGSQLPQAGDDSIVQRVSPPARGAWIATRTRGRAGRFARSPPARGAWIATFTYTPIAGDQCSRVASREGGVDRNYLSAYQRSFGAG